MSKAFFIKDLFGTNRNFRHNKQKLSPVSTPRTYKLIIKVPSGTRSLLFPPQVFQKE